MNNLRVSVLVPAVDEVVSLARTVDEVQRRCSDAAGQIIIILCERTSLQCRQTAAQLVDRYPGVVVICEQRRGRLGGAFLEALQVAQGSHVVTMFSDLESDPGILPEMLAVAGRHPRDIISASRWLSGGGFQGYGQIKLAVNFLAQVFSRLLFRAAVTDFTLGYRVVPRSVLDSTRWEEAGHAFVYESILKPIRLGIRVREVPTIWRSRKEGRASGSWRTYLAYMRVAIRVRLMPVAEIADGEPQKEQSTWPRSTRLRPPSNETG